MKNIIFYFLLFLFVPISVFAEIDAKKSFEVAESALENGNYRKAIKFYEKALQTSISGNCRQEAYYNLFLISYRLNDKNKLAYYETKCNKYVQGFKEFKNDGITIFYMNEIKRLYKNNKYNN